MLKIQSTGWSVLEIQIEDSATIYSLLFDIAINNIEFRKAVFDTDRRQCNKLINFFLNDKLLHPLEMEETELPDGDMLLLLPTYAGV
jgi:hypothetical protein